jgi:hypothetical protein
VAGFFCVYENAGSGMSFQGASGVPGTETRGMGIAYNVLAANAAAYGSWAVTAP